MASCYDCSDRIPPGRGIRYSVQTGFSVGAKSSRLHYRQVVLCPTCASVRRKRDEQAVVRFGIVAAVIFIFITVYGAIKPSETRTQSQESREVLGEEKPPQDIPVDKPTPKTLQGIPPTTLPKAVSSPTMSQATLGAFNAEIFAPPSNCRVEPGKDRPVKQLLRQKGDVLVDRANPKTDSKGELWYKEQYLECWLHNSQIRFK